MVNKRTVLWVSPGDDGWKVKKQGAGRASSIHKTKEEAVKRAKELAKGQMLSQVKVQKRDGTIEKEWTYGEDPRQTPG